MTSFFFNSKSKIEVQKKVDDYLVRGVETFGRVAVTRAHPEEVHGGRFQVSEQVNRCDSFRVGHIHHL